MTEIPTEVENELEAALTEEEEEWLARATAVLSIEKDYHLPGLHDQCDHSITGECTADPNDPRAPLFKVEREIIKGENETAVFFDANSNEQWNSKKGTRGQVDFESHERAAIRKHGNLVLTHNHPDPQALPGLSHEDVLAAANFNLAEIRAVQIRAEGKYTVVFKRPKDGWPPQAVLQRATAEANDAVFNLLVGRFYAGKLGMEAMNKAHFPAVNALLAKRMGAEYKIIRTKNRKAA